jgi:hypothetical protein
LLLVNMLQHMYQQLVIQIQPGHVSGHLYGTNKADE